jgi:hypothetical protein
MRDDDYARQLQYVNKVFREVKAEIWAKKPDIEVADFVTFALGKPKLRSVLEYAFLAEFYARHNISSRSGPPGDREELKRDRLDLDEGAVIKEHDAKGHVVSRKAKRRADWTKADMINIGRQKETNIKNAEHAYRLWQWETGLLFPIFDEHPDWIYRRAYDALCTRLGGEPVPPI